MNLRLDTIKRDEHQQVRQWRQTCRETLRTPYMLTEAQQDAHYDAVVCHPEGQHQYFAVRDKVGAFLAEVQLENIDRVNQHAEMGLIVDPTRHGKGIGRAAVALILEEAFDRQNLLTVWLECYYTGHTEFWASILNTYGGTSTTWPRRKFWGGVLHDAMLGTITAEGWRASREKSA